MLQSLLELRCTAPGSGGARVLLIARSNHAFGGLVTYLSDLAETLCTSGHEVVIAINEEAHPAEALQQLRPGVELISLRHSKDSALLSAELSEMVDAYKPDVLHVNFHNHAALGGIPQIRDFSHCRPLRLATLHGDIAGLGNTAEWDLWKWRRPVGELRKRHRVRRFVLWFDRIISVSEAIGSRLPGALCISPRRVVSIPNGVDVNRFAPWWSAQNEQPCARWQRDGGRAVRIGCSGGLYKYKGFDVAIRAMAKVAKHIELELRIAGAGPEESALRALAVELGVAEKVAFLGRVTDIPEFVQSVDLLLCPSLSVETSCFSQLEAMAAGLPSVCSHYSDLAVRVRDGTDGLLVKRGDVAGFAAAIEAIVCDPSNYAAMSLNARSRVLSKYSKEAYMQATSNVYDSVLSGVN